MITNSFVLADSPRVSRSSPRADSAVLPRDELIHQKNGDHPSGKDDVQTFPETPSVFTPPGLSPRVVSLPQDVTIRGVEPTGLIATTKKICSDGYVRARPSPPTGPCKPSCTTGPLTFMAHKVHHASRKSKLSPSGPYVRPRKLPAPPIRVFTLDRVRRTFTSDQLQDVVSQAIRQSAKHSSFRLLLPDNLAQIRKDIEGPKLLREIAVMEYQILVQRQGDILKTLAIHFDDPQERSLHLGALKDVCTSLDNSAKWWHEIDKQVAELSLLCQIHFASALAVALRKLHSIIYVT